MKPKTLEQLIDSRPRPAQASSLLLAAFAAALSAPDTTRASQTELFCAADDSLLELIGAIRPKPRTCRERGAESSLPGYIIDGAVYHVVRAADHWIVERRDPNRATVALITAVDGHARAIRFLAADGHPDATVELADPRAWTPDGNCEAWIRPVSQIFAQAPRWWTQQKAKEPRPFRNTMAGFGQAAADLVDIRPAPGTLQEAKKNIAGLLQGRIPENAPIRHPVRTTQDFIEARKEAVRHYRELPEGDEKQVARAKFVGTVMLLALPVKALSKGKAAPVPPPKAAPVTRITSTETIAPASPAVKSLPERLLAATDPAELARLNKKSASIRSQAPHVHTLDTILYLKKTQGSSLPHDLLTRFKQELKKHEDLMDRDFGAAWEQHFGLTHL